MLRRLGHQVRSLGPAFGSLLVYETLSVAALMAGEVAVAWWIIHVGGGSDIAFYAGTIAATSLVSLPLLSPLGDRCCKRTLMAASIGMIAIAAFALAALAQTTTYNLPEITALGAVITLASAVHHPASATIVAEMLPPAQLTMGLNLQKSGQTVGRLLGPTIGGIFLAIGTPATLWLSFVLLCGCCALIVFVPQTTRLPVSRPTLGEWIAEMRAGFVAKWVIGIERWWTLASFIFAVFLSPSVGLLVALKLASLHLNGSWFGICEAVLSAGILFGTLGGSGWLAVRLGRFNTYTLAAVAISAILVLVGVSHVPAILPLLLAVAGFCLATMQMVGQTHRMLAIPASFRARMMSVHKTVMQVAATIGPAVSGVSLDRIGLDGTYVLFGAIMLVVALGYAAVPGFRSFIRMSHDGVTGLYGRSHPELFERTVSETN